MSGSADHVKSDGYSPLRDEVEFLDKKYAMPIGINMPLPNRLSSHGWVYILSNPYMPGLLKIGMTTISPEIRCKELSSGTNVPVPFVIEASYFSVDPRGDESSIHQTLSECRVNNSREFFKCSLADADEICRSFCLCESSSSIEALADSHDVICLDEGFRLDLQEWFEDSGVSVVGPQVNAAKAIFELGCDRLQEMRKDGLGMIIESGFISGILTEDMQNNLAYLQESHEKAMSTGIYGPRQPRGF